MFLILTASLTPIHAYCTMCLIIHYHFHYCSPLPLLVLTTHCQTISDHHSLLILHYQSLDHFLCTAFDFDTYFSHGLSLIFRLQCLTLVKARVLPDLQSIAMLTMWYYFLRNGKSTIKFNWQKTKWTWIFKKWQIIHPPPLVVVVGQTIMSISSKTLCTSLNCEWHLMTATSLLRHLRDFLPSVCPSSVWKSSLSYCFQLHLKGYSKLLLF